MKLHFVTTSGKEWIFNNVWQLTQVGMHTYEFLSHTENTTEFHGNTIDRQITIKTRIVGVESVRFV